MKNQFLLIRVRSDNAYERGLQYGAQADRLIHDALNGYKRHFLERRGLTWESILEKARKYLPELSTECVDELEEIRGIADGSNTLLEEILVLNCRYEILKMAPIHNEPHECTTGAVLKESTATKDTVYLMQNWDYRPWVKEHSVILSIDDKKGTRIIGITEAGQLLRNGMNNHGLGVCANNLTSIYDDVTSTGIPVTFVRRKALNCRTYEEVQQVIDSCQRSVSCNFLIASSGSQAVDIEATPQKNFYLKPEDGILTHANHMVAGADVCTDTGKKFRDIILRRLLREQNGRIDVQYIMECLKNHETDPSEQFTYPQSNCIEAICSHVPFGKYSNDYVWETIASSIYDLKNGIAYICKGNPCCGTYIPYNV